MRASGDGSPPVGSRGEAPALPAEGLGDGVPPEAEAFCKCVT